MNREAIDQQSFELIRQGGHKRGEGVSALFVNYEPEFKRFFVYQCGNADDADDLVQETFIKIVRNCESYRGESPLRAWLWQIAWNCLNDYWRRKKNRPTENLDDDGWSALEQNSTALQAIDPPLAGDTLEDCVSRGFREFAKKQPERAYALSLVVEGFDTNYISNFLNRKEGATREYLSQCRKKIEIFLKPCREHLSSV
jgi:RNA polymerase sigma-70 factor (ECF subfamily)